MKLRWFEQIEKHSNAKAHSGIIDDISCRVSVEVRDDDDDEEDEEEEDDDDDGHDNVRWKSTSHTL